MAAISQKIIGLIGGVSQQPDSLMLPGQFRECDNFYPDPTFGLLKRPGSKFIRHLASPNSNGSWFFVRKSDETKLLVQISKTGDVKIWDSISGIPQTVNSIAASAQTYATHSKKEDIEVLQINDYIFVLNRGVTVENGTATSASQTPFGYVTLTTIAYDTEYKVVVDGVTFTYQSPVSTGSRLNTETIINALRNAIDGDSRFSATAVANNIFIERTNGNDFTLTATGSIAGSGLKAFKGTIKGVDDLPAQAPNGKIITVLGGSDSPADDYYLRFETTTGSGSGAGVWKEVVGPGVNLGVNPATMPHAIITEADGSYSFRELSETSASAFTSSTNVTGIVTGIGTITPGNLRWSIGQVFPVYGGSGKNLLLRVTSVNSDKEITGVEIARAGQGYVATETVTSNEGDSFVIDTVATKTISGSTWATEYWGERTAGDEDSALDPSFIGSQITGISFFKNRLVLMSQETVITSQAGEFLKFYPSTVLTLVDSDPIDLSAGATRRISLRHAIQQANALILFADNAQYLLQTRTEAFSPATAELNLLSSFSHTNRNAPIDLGTTLVITEENDRSVAVTELTVNYDQNPLKKELSKLIPSYIPNTITDVTNSLSASMFAFSTEQEKDALYLFRYYTQDNERLIASWFRWKFPGNLVMFKFDNDEAYAVIDTDNELALVSFELLTETPGGAIFFEDKYVDLRMDLFDYNPSKTYVPADDKTRIFFKQGADIADGTPCLVKISTDDSSFVSFPTMEEDAGSYYVEVDGDETGEQYALGYRVTSEARFPAFYVKQEKQADELNIPVVHRVRLYSHESGPFEAQLDSPGRNTFTLTLPQITSNLTNLNAAPMIRTAENIVPIMAKGTEADLKVICNSPFPLALVSMTWEGTYNNKGIKAV